MHDRIEPLAEAHFDRLHELFDAVCREERFMAFTQAGPREQTHAYYRGILAGGHTHLVASRGDVLIGWCDVLPLHGQMRAHAGVLGMAAAPPERGCWWRVPGPVYAGGSTTAHEMAHARCNLRVHGRSSAEALDGSRPREGRDAPGLRAVAGPGACPPMTLRRRVALLLVLLVAGAAVGVIGSGLSGSALWFLAIPAALLAGWLWVADPTQCVPHDGGGDA